MSRKMVNDKKAATLAIVTALSVVQAALVDVIDSTKASGIDTIDTSKLVDALDIVCEVAQKGINSAMEGSLYG